LDIGKVAHIMEKAGAIGLSILTEPNYFQGSYKNLELAIKNTSIPCLMKDFIIDEIQIKMASYLGASNVLLINSIIELEDFYKLAVKYNLEPLIEIHEEQEIKDLKKLVEVGYTPKLIGVNNRNLHTLNIDLQTSQKLIPLIKREIRDDVIIVSESGIQSYKDVIKLKKYGADAFLIGTLIMQSKNIRETIKNLRGKGGNYSA
jgi:indole-3-glycerol phosphate synthase